MKNQYSCDMKNKEQRESRKKVWYRPEVVKLSVRKTMSGNGNGIENLSFPHKSTVISGA